VICAYKLEDYNINVESTIHYASDLLESIYNDISFTVPETRVRSQSVSQKTLIDELIVVG